MDKLCIAATQHTPKVVLDSTCNLYEIEGESIPENAMLFYMPIIKWLTEYKGVMFFSKNEFGKASTIRINFKFDYFNSTSAKFILDIFNVLHGYIKDNLLAEINWHYQDGDTDMLEAGEEFAKLCPKIPVNFVVIK